MSYSSNTETARLENGDEVKFLFDADARNEIAAIQSLPKTTPIEQSEPGNRAAPKVIGYPGYKVHWMSQVPSWPTITLAILYLVDRAKPGSILIALKQAESSKDMRTAILGQFQRRLSFVEARPALHGPIVTLGAIFSETEREPLTVFYYDWYPAYTKGFESLAAQRR